MKIQIWYPQKTSDNDQNHWKQKEKNGQHPHCFAIPQLSLFEKTKCAIAQAGNKRIRAKTTNH
jgi:hypothetical protein